MTPPSLRLRPARLRFVATALASAVALAGAISETSRYRAKGFGHYAQLSSETADHGRTLAYANRALGNDPTEERALYARAATLKKLDRAKALREALPDLLRLHRSQASVRRLAGERAYLDGDAASASGLLAEALRINPVPPASAANFHRMAALAARAAGDAAFARAAAAASLRFARSDPTLPPGDRPALERDMRAILNEPSRSR